MVSKRVLRHTTRQHTISPDEPPKEPELGVESDESRCYGDDQTNRQDSNDQLVKRRGIIEIRGHARRRNLRRSGGVGGIGGHFWNVAPPLSPSGISGKVYSCYDRVSNEVDTGKHHSAVVPLSMGHLVAANLQRLVIRKGEIEVDKA